MPLRNRLGRLARLATLPETRSLIVATVRSTTPRTLARRAAEVRAAPLRDLANPASARRLARRAITHPAVAELANASLVFLPGRYVPLGWAATWATRRVLRRYLVPQVEAREVTSTGAGRPATTEARHGTGASRGREGP